MKKHCFNCDHIQPKRIGENFATICDKTEMPTNPGAVACADFTPEVKRTKRTPKTIKKMPNIRGKKYTIKNRFLRRLCRGLNWDFVPRNPDEELAFAGLLDKLNKIINSHIRRTAKRAINQIGRKD